MGDISDIYLHAILAPGGKLVLDVRGSLIFPGPRCAQSEEDVALLHKLFESVAGNSRREFSIRVHQPIEAIYRVHRVDTAVDGVWFRLRSTTLTVPTLHTLPSRLPAHIERMLMSKEISSGGIILVAGPPGSGKTTTATAAVASRLQAYGGFGYTIEDPPEILALNGWHGPGYCTQTEVYPGVSGWEESIKDLLRSQPVGARLLLYVGEIRTAEAARMMVRAASNGFLVITTTFATDILSAIDTFYQLLGADYTASLAATLRVVLYQRLRFIQTKRVVEAQALFSEGPSSRVAAAIRSRQLGQLIDELTYQTNQARRLIAAQQ